MILQEIFLLILFLALLAGILSGIPAMLAIAGMPLLVGVMRRAGAIFGFVDPTAGNPPRSRHVLGGLRMSDDPALSVCDPFGQLHGIDNLFCMDGGVMPSGSGYNPTLTLIALTLRAAGNLVEPGGAERRIGKGSLGR